jgi:hypothetical protein
MAERIAATFIGPRDEQGAPIRYLEGIPARDLTESEFAALPDDDKVRIAENAANKDHAVYRLKPKEADQVSEIVQTDPPAPKPARATAGRVADTNAAPPSDPAPKTE